MKDDEIPVALQINLDGGYAMFVDNFDDRDSYRWMLCHKCAHEFVSWVGADLSHAHPNTKEEFCNGWTQEWFNEQYEKQFNRLFPNN